MTGLAWKATENYNRISPFYANHVTKLYDMGFESSEKLLT